MAWASSACSLNPQPLPPDQADGAGGAGDATSFGSGNDAADEDVGTTPLPSDAGEDATLDATSEDGATGEDASDAGDAGDAGEALDGDAGRDADDAGDSQ